jgi:hypothetical protein
VTIAIKKIFIHARTFIPLGAIAIPPSGMSHTLGRGAAMKFIQKLKKIINFRSPDYLRSH